MGTFVLGTEMTGKNEWIVDVLQDLKSFCASNGLDDVARRLDETSDYVAKELDRNPGRFLISGDQHTARFNS